MAVTPLGVEQKTALLGGRARLCEPRERPPHAGLVKTARDRELQEPQP